MATTSSGRFITGLELNPAVLNHDQLRSLLVLSSGWSPPRTPRGTFTTCIRERNEQKLSNEQVLDVMMSLLIILEKSLLWLGLRKWPSYKDGSF